MSRKGNSFRTPTAGLLVVRAVLTANTLTVDGRCIRGNLVPGDNLWLRFDGETSARWQIVCTMMYDRDVKYIPTGHTGRIILTSDTPSPEPAAGSVLSREDVG